MYKNHKFFLTYQNPSNRNNEYIDEIETNILKNENEFSKEAIKDKSKELKVKQLKDQKEKELRELKVKQLKDQKEKELRELKVKQLKDQKEKELKELKIKKESNLLFD